MELYDPSHRGATALAGFLTLSLLAWPCLAQSAGEGRIQPYEQDPCFWEYQGEPVLLLGGSDQDNLFNHPDIGPDGLESHLDLLVASGGNYVRNTMSSRDEGNPWPFARDEETGLYDLNEMGDTYWQRFENFLEWTAERDIIVQIEVFDRFDYAQEPWDRNPFNPANNVNYTAETSGLPEQIGTHPALRENPFFRSVPELDENHVLLPFQEAFVDRMLSVSLEYGHVLYCISNETNEDEPWSAYWAQYIRDAANEAGVEVHVTEMWDPHDLSHPMHDRTFENPDLYTYVDISQNNHQTGQAHADAARQQRERVADAPRPINNVKMYGGLTHGGGYEPGLAKLWHNVLGGNAAARYHRPGEWTDDGPLHGAGLGEDVQAYLYTTRTLMEQLGWPDIEPDTDLVQQVGPFSAVDTEKTHVVYARNADGEARFYIDGRRVAEEEIEGDFVNWDDQMHLGLASEFTGQRNWRGIYHELALYDRSLSSSEIADHYEEQAVQHREGLQARYSFVEGGGEVIAEQAHQAGALDLHIEDPEAVNWTDEGLQVDDDVLIGTQSPAESLVRAMQESGALTVEAWISPADVSQSGPARIVTLSADHSHRNFTLGQQGDDYEMRLRTTETSANGIPAVSTGPDEDASIAAARSVQRDGAVIFVSHEMELVVDMDQLHGDLQASWVNPRTTERQDAEAQPDGNFQPPSDGHWLLVLE